MRKIDTAQGKLTIKHEAIENLQMPGMTMVFKATDSTMLQKLQVGDKIQFASEKVNGAIVVTNIQAAKYSSTGRMLDNLSGLSNEVSEKVML